MDSFDLREEFQSLQDISSYEIPNKRDISAMDERSVINLLESKCLIVSLNDHANYAL
jgi:hypothetical protein